MTQAKWASTTQPRKSCFIPRLSSRNFFTKTGSAPGTVRVPVLSPNCDATTPQMVQDTGLAQQYHLHQIGINCNNNRSHRQSINKFGYSKCSMVNLSSAYRSDDEESSKQIPKRHYKGYQYVCEHRRWGQCHQHHAKQCEVVEALNDEEQEIEELVGFPLVSNHRINDECVQTPLKDVVDDLHACLRKSHNIEKMDGFIFGHLQNDQQIAAFRNYTSEIQPELTHPNNEISIKMSIRLRRNYLSQCIG